MDINGAATNKNYIKKHNIYTDDIWYYANLRLIIDIDNADKVKNDIAPKLRELNFECSLIEQGDVDKKDYFFQIGISRQKYNDFKDHILSQYHTNIELSPYQIYNWIKNSILNCKELKFLKEKQYKTKIFAKPVYKYEKLNLLKSLIKPELYWEKDGHPIFNEILETSGPANALYFLFLYYYIVSLFFLTIFSVPAVLSQYNIINDPHKLVQCSFGVFIVLYSFFILKFWKRKSNLFRNKNKELERIFENLSNIVIQEISNEVSNGNEAVTDNIKTLKYNKVLILSEDYTTKDLSPEQQNKRIKVLIGGIGLTILCLLNLPMLYIALIIFKIKVINSEIISNVISAVAILMSNYFYEKFTKFLTKHELHPNTKAFDQCLMYKLVLFEVVNFTEPVFISFLKSGFSLFGVPDFFELCDNMNAKGSTGCYGDLESFLLTMFMTNFVVNIFIQIKPLLGYLYKKFKHGGIRGLFQKILKGVESEFYRPKFKLFDEYNYIVVQSSFLIIFGTACSLAPAICLALYFFEFLIDPIKILCLFRLPKHTSFKELADWDDVFLLHGIMAIFIVPFLIGFSYPLVDYYTSNNQYIKMWVIFALVFILQFFKFFVEKCINDDSRRLKEEKAIEELRIIFIRLKTGLNIPITRAEQEAA